MPSLNFLQFSIKKIKEVGLAFCLSVVKNLTIKFDNSFDKSLYLSVI